MRQKPKEQPNLEDVIKESVIEASHTEGDVHQQAQRDIQEIDDAAEELLHQSLTNFDDEDREADQIRLRRLGQEQEYDNQRRHHGQQLNL